MMVYIYKKYAEYTELRRISNYHEIMTNVMSTDGDGVWRWI